MLCAHQQYSADLHFSLDVSAITADQQRRSTAAAAAAAAATATAATGASDLWRSTDSGQRQHDRR